MDSGHQQFKRIETPETKSKSSICDMLMGISNSERKNRTNHHEKNDRFLGKDFFFMQKRGGTILFLELGNGSGKGRRRNRSLKRHPEQEEEPG